MDLVVVGRQLLVVLVEELSAHFLNLLKLVLELSLILISLKVDLIADLANEGLLLGALLFESLVQVVLGPGQLLLGRYLVALYVRLQRFDLLIEELIGLFYLKRRLVLHRLQFFNDRVLRLSKPAGDGLCPSGDGLLEVLVFLDLLVKLPDALDVHLVLTPEVGEALLAVGLQVLREALRIGDELLQLVHMLVHLSLLALVLKLEQEALVVELADVGLGCRYASEGHRVVPQGVEEIADLLDSHHARSMVERVAVVDSEAWVLCVVASYVAARQEAVVEHRFPGLLLDLVLPALVVGVELVNPEVQLFDLFLDLGVDLGPLFDLLVYPCMEDREVLESVCAQVLCGLLLRPLEEHLRDSA